MSDNVWSELHKDYKDRDWINKPSLFAETAVTYFPAKGRVLDLGAGQGQDSRFFAEHGYEVVNTDLEETALEQSKAKLSDELKQKVALQKVDLREELLLWLSFLHCSNLVAKSGYRRPLSCLLQGVQPLSTGVIQKEKSQKINSETFLDLFANLVRVVDYRWNCFEAELRLMHSKLERFGLTTINDEVVYCP